MKWKLSLPEPQMLVYYFVKLTGLAPFTVEKDGFHPPTLLAKLYSISLACAYFIVVIIAAASKLRNLKTLNVSTLVKLGSVIENLTSHPTTFITMVIFLLMYKRIVHIMNKLCVISNGLKSMNSEKNVEKFCHNVLVTTALTNAVVVAAGILFCHMESVWPTLLSIKYAVDIWFQVNTMLIFTQLLFFIKYLFTLVNKNLHDVFRPAGHRRFVNNSPIFLVRRIPRVKTRPSIEDLIDLQRIRKIEALHLALCDLMYDTSHLFAFPVLLKSLDFCTELMVNCFWMYGVIRDKSSQLYTAEEFGSLLKRISPTLLRTVIAIFQLFAFAYASVKTCREGSATKAVLFRVWCKFESRKLEDEFSMFSLQMLHKSVTVSIFGFFDLDYTYVYKIFCIVVAYVIIMIQLDTE